MNFLLWRVAGVGGLMPRNEVLAAEDGVPWDDIAGVGGLKMGLLKCVKAWLFVIRRPPAKN